MTKNGVARQRRTFTEELAHDMVRLEQRIKQAAGALDWLAAAHLEMTRDEVMYTRMQVLRKVWRER